MPKGRAYGHQVDTVRGEVHRRRRDPLDRADLAGAEEEKKGKKKVEKLGTRRVTAEVRKVDAGGYVSLSVLECELLTNTHGLPLKPLKKGEIIRKQRSTIGKGSGERLKWSHEDARSLVVSKFLN
jgi:hypothetical protein